MSYKLAATATTLTHAVIEHAHGLRRRMREGGDEGLALIEYLVLAGVIILAVLAVAAILTSKLSAKANSLNL